MDKYRTEETEKVLKHLYHTLTACIDYLAEVRVRHPVRGQELFEESLIGLHTDLEEHWGASLNMAAEIEEEEAEQQQQTDGYTTLTQAGADIIPIMEADAKKEVEEEWIANEQLREEIAGEEYILPAGWPLDHV